MKKICKDSEQKEFVLASKSTAVTNQTTQEYNQSNSELKTNERQEVNSDMFWMDHLVRVDDAQREAALQRQNPTTVNLPCMISISANIDDSDFMGGVKLPSLEYVEKIVSTNNQSARTIQGNVKAEQVCNRKAGALHRELQTLAELFQYEGSL